MIKRIIQSLIIALVALFVFLPVQEVAYAAEKSDAAVITMSATTSDKEVTVTADLRQNTALNALAIELYYDTTAMTLIRAEQGSALRGLEYLTAGSYSSAPFRIIWGPEEENDYSTGVIVKLYFTIKEDARDGDYTIALKPYGNSAATYIEEGNNIESKNVLIDSTRIRIENNMPTVEKTVETVEAEEKKPNIALIVSLSVGGAAVLAGTVVLVLKLKGKKTWKKVK